MNKVYQNKQTEKLEINLGHDVTIELILNALGYEVKAVQPYSSVIFFEYRQEEVSNQTYVTTIYNNQPITFGLWVDVKCPFETFKQNILNRVQSGNIYEICEESMKLKGVSDINPE